MKVFFYCNGVVHYESLPQGRTVNKEYYLEVMRRLREAIPEKRTELWKSQSWILHHDSTPAQISLLVREFLAKNKTCNHASNTTYSTDLAPADFFLFLTLKTSMKGKRFTMIEQIKEKSKQKLLAIPKRAYQKGFRDWK